MTILMVALKYFGFSLDEKLKDHAYENNSATTKEDVAFLKAMSDLPTYKKKIYLKTLEKASNYTRRTN